MNDPIIEIRSLLRRFGRLNAVDAISVSVNAREVFGLLGSNGAGKTTTIKMLTTLLPPSAGDALIAGLSIKTNSVGVRRAIGYVPQAESVDGSLTGYENLLIFAKLYDIPRGERETRIRETTYVVDALRTFMVNGSKSTLGLTTDYTVLLLRTIVLIAIAARLYPRLAT